MLRMFLSISGGQAKKYFRDALSKADYYIQDQEMNGRFHGEVAKRLELDKTLVKKDIFDLLCDNINPITKAPLTPVTADDRRVGYDINFHAPKSVSIVHALSKDDHILKVFKNCVQATMNDLEKDMQTRVRVEGQNFDRDTSEMLWADFVHQTARPVGNNPPDMHLHCHNFVFNVTYDKEENRFKAGQFHDLKRDMPYYQAKFQKRLAGGLANLGYKIRKTNNGFELAMVPQAAIDHFSKRTNLIGQIAKDQKITNPKVLDHLGSITRQEKNNRLSMNQLRKAWKEGLKKAGISEKEKGEDSTANPELTAKNTIDYSLQHLFERASVKRDRQILAEAFRHSIDNMTVTFEAIKKAFEEDKRIFKVRHGKSELCTTDMVHLEEREMVQLAREFRSQLYPLAISVDPKFLDGLNSQQSMALNLVLTSSDRLVMIKGGAGTGKTTMIKNAVKAIEQSNTKVFLYAPTAEAARDVLQAEGFTNADTVSRLLLDTELQNKMKGQVIWVDEAGMLGTKVMLDLLTLTKKFNARLILSGDPKQHSSVVRGDAMRILNSVAKIPYQNVNIIYRQKIKRYREAVSLISQGKIKSGFDCLVSMGAIEEIKTDEAIKRLSSSYLDAISENKTALVISPTNKQAREVVKRIRTGLREQKEIVKSNRPYPIFQNLYLSEAQKTDSRQYEVGQVLQFYQNIKQIKRGSRLEVVDVSSSSVTIKDKFDELHTLDRSNAQSFDVFRQREIDLAIGDKIRIKKNSFDRKGRRLDNGKVLKVVGFRKDGSIVAESDTPKRRIKFLIASDFGNFDYAYCITSYASQGKTVDRVLIYQPAATFAASNQKQFYVSVSRGREAVTIYTDHKDELLQSVSKDGDRMSTHELFDLPQARQAIELNRLHELQNEPVNQSENREELEDEPAV